MTGLTDRQRDIYCFLIEFFNVHKWMPTCDEIADQFNIQRSGAWFHLKAIEKKGYITMGNGARTIRINHRKYGVVA